MVLLQQGVVDRYPLILPGNYKAEQVGDHERHHDLVILGKLEDHEYGSHGSADDAGKHRAHPYHGVSPGIRRRERRMRMDKRSHSPTQHSSQKQTGSKNAARVS